MSLSWVSKLLNRNKKTNSAELKSINKPPFLITKGVIKPLKPCKDRWDNYLKFYGDKSFTKRQFMGLKNITHEDKMWVAFRLMSAEKVMRAAADIAESVLHIYEEAYPGDLRPRKAIEAVRRGDRNAYYDAANAAYTAAATTATYAARAAAADAAHYAAAAAADAAHYAAAAAADAADAAYYAARAARAATYAARAARAATYAARAARAATYAAAAAADAATSSNRPKQEKLIRTIVLKYWKED
jgi:hypothetical protein